MKQKPTKICETGVQLRPASIEEAGLFYSELDKAQDEALGTVGHIRMDFGSGGKEFWHTWWPHNEDRFNTPEFKAELQEFVDALRANGPLKNLSAMSSYCYQNGGAITADGHNYGYIADTEHYRYCLRCNPTPGDYQGYLYCYDKRQQRMASEENVVGRISYADGTKQEFSDPQQYLQTIKEELPYLNVYADFDLDVGEVCDALTVIQACGDGSEETYRYPLTEEERLSLRSKMNDYCMEQTGMSLDEYRAQYLTEVHSISFPENQTM